MRRPNPLGLATIGLAISLSAGLRAQEPTPSPSSMPRTDASKPVAAKDVVVDPTNPETWNSKNTTAAERRRMRRQKEIARIPVGVLSEAQAAQLRKQGSPQGWNPAGPAGATLVAGPGVGNGGCASCAAAASGMPMTSGVPAGYTIVENAPSGSPPGYAIVGAATPSAEPTPIGVMRTSYGNSPAAASPSSMPGYASVGAPLASMAGAPGSVPPPVNPVPPQPLRRPHIIAHVFGFSGRTPGRSIMDRRNARERSQHAAIAYNGDSSVSELPGSVVYGR